MKLYSLADLAALGVEPDTSVKLNEKFINSVMNDDAITRFASTLKTKNAYLHALGRTVLSLVGTPTRGTYLKHELKRHGEDRYYLKPLDMWQIDDLTLIQDDGCATCRAYPLFRSAERELLSLFHKSEDWMAVIDPFGGTKQQSRVSKRPLVVVRRVNFHLDMHETKALIFTPAALL